MSSRSFIVRDEELVETLRRLGRAEVIALPSFFVVRPLPMALPSLTDDLLPALQGMNTICIDINRIVPTSHRLILRVSQEILDAAAKTRIAVVKLVKNGREARILVAASVAKHSRYGYVLHLYVPAIYVGWTATELCVFSAPLGDEKR